MALAEFSASAFPPDCHTKYSLPACPEGTRRALAENSASARGLFAKTRKLSAECLLPMQPRTRWGLGEYSASAFLKVCLPNVWDLWVGAFASAGINCSLHCAATHSLSFWPLFASGCGSPGIVLIEWHVDYIRWTENTQERSRTNLRLVWEW